MPLQTPGTAPAANDWPPDQAPNRDLLRQQIPRLPAFPASAARVVRAARTGCISAEQLVQLAKSDPVLAGNFIAAANSGSSSWGGTVGTVEKAAMYIGEVRGTQVLLRAALKPVLAVVGHSDLWEHSVDAANVAVRLAMNSGKVSEPDAYILGLLHDVGELLLKLAPPTYGSQLNSLVKGGLSRPDAEIAVFGASHAQIGADILNHWRLPEEYGRAVEFHHTPEAGGEEGAALLYLCEQWTDAKDDTCSDERLETARITLGLPSLEAGLSGQPKR